jgi:RNA polymerase sigma-70 factor (ECF subfamily)
MTSTPTSHAEWVRAALDRYEAALVGYALRFTNGNLETARDVVQDTFLKLCTADRAKIDGHIGPWLYTVCRNRALDVAKKEGRMEPLKDGIAEAVPSMAPAPSATAERRETHDLVLEVVDGLPPNQQELFKLKFQDGLTYREISEITDTPISNISYHIHAALGKIRDRLRANPDLAAELGGF